MTPDEDRNVRARLDMCRNVIARTLRSMAANTTSRRVIDLAPIVGVHATIQGMEADDAANAAKFLADLIEPDEVTHCRDCVFFGESDDMAFSPWCWRDPDHTGHGEPTDEDGFCCWAEPREEAGDGGE